MLLTEHDPVCVADLTYISPYSVYQRVSCGGQTCVCPGVPLQLVAAREAFAAEDPVADEGPLASVQAHVGPEEGRFPERLLAAWDVTDVLPLPYLAGPAQHRKHKLNYTIYTHKCMWSPLQISGFGYFSHTCY